MKCIIVIQNPENSWPMYVSEVSFEKREDKTAAIAYKSTSNKSQAMIFIEDEDLKLAFNMINLYNKRFHKAYKLEIESL